MNEVKLLTIFALFFFLIISVSIVASAYVKVNKEACEKLH